MMCHSHQPCFVNQVPPDLSALHEAINHIRSDLSQLKSTLPNILYPKATSSVEEVIGNATAPTETGTSADANDESIAETTASPQSFTAPPEDISMHSFEVEDITEDPNLNSPLPTTQL